jgi:predicted kinase
VPTLHVVSGLPASGKTTYARNLRDRVDGVLFCLDRWLITLFGRYSLAEVGQEEHVRRVLACRELIFEAATPLLRRSVDVILDDGFFYREHRMQHVALAAEQGARTTTHVVDTPLDRVRERLARRNADLPKYNFYIDPATLDGFLGMYQRPTADEGATLVIVSDGRVPEHLPADTARSIA